MPIFEYRCEACGHKFEAILFGAQTPECPQCHTDKLEKQLSTFAVSVGKGSDLAGCRLRAEQLLHDKWRWLRNKLARPGRTVGSILRLAPMPGAKLAARLNAIIFS